MRIPNTTEALNRNKTNFSPSCRHTVHDLFLPLSPATHKTVKAMCSEGIIERYVNFYTDFAFKKLFGTEINKELLVSFLNALLEGKEVVRDITYLNTERLGTQEYDRRAVFDVYCQNEKGEYFLVEMQKGEQQFFKDRSIYYSSFAIREQAPKGVWDYELKSIYTIGILNFCFEKEGTDYRTSEDGRLIEAYADELRRAALARQKLDLQMKRFNE